MSNPEIIKTAFERNEKALQKQPALGRKTGKVVVHASNGLACEIQCGPFTFRADMPETVGGEKSAPTPGMYEAGALGSCIAIMTKMWGAKLAVPIQSVEVEVEYDADTRFLFDVGNVPSHWAAIRYHISVESTAPEGEVMRVLDKAHQQSHVRGDFEHAHTVKRQVTINLPASSKW